MYVVDRFLQQLKFEDPEGKTIADLQWYANDKRGSWVGFTVPADKEIIGIQCNTDQLQIHTLGFILWTPNPSATKASR